jgi:hypothetical protein
LYLEANTASIPWPLSFLISPIDSVNRLITGNNSAGNIGKLYALDFYSGGAYVQMDFSEKSRGKHLFSFNGPVVIFGANVVYGFPQRGNGTHEGLVEK